MFDDFGVAAAELYMYLKNKCIKKKRNYIPPIFGL